MFFTLIFKKEWNLLVLIFTLLFSLHNAQLLGGWSSPPTVIYPLSPPNNATNPSIATNENGDAVAVWFDISGSGSMRGATLAAGAVNSEGQPAWVLTHPIASAHVQDPQSPYAQAVGIDKNGVVTAVWSDGTFVYVSRLAFGHKTWSSPLVINDPLINQIVSNLYIAVAANGNAIVTWTSSTNPYNGTIFANIYDSDTQTWLGQTNLLSEGGIEFELTVNPVAIDPQGNGTVLVNANSNNVQAISYNHATETWTQIPSIVQTFLVSYDGAMDASGNAIIIWVEADNTVHVATLPSNGTTLVNPIVLSTQADFITSIPQVITDSEGNGVAVWSDLSGGLASARYDVISATWNSLPLLNLSGKSPYLISLGGDANGNAVASWTVLNKTTYYIQSAALGASDAAWRLLSTLSSRSSFANNSQIVLAKGNAVAVWENDVNFGVGIIESSIFLDIFTPVIEQVLPHSGSMSGGDRVTLIGKNFTGAIAVSFGNLPAESFKVNSDYEITAISPPGSGRVSITVITPGGVSSSSTRSQFTYISLYPPTHIQKKQTHGCQSHHKVTNVITWQPPSQGEKPVVYKIFTDVSLTHCIGCICAHRHQQHFKFKDHCLNRRRSYTYYLVSVDARGFQSEPAVVRIEPKGSNDSL